jgi:hypothetical protein
MTGRRQNSDGGRTAALEEMAGTRNCGHCREWRTGRTDPLLPFNFRPMNGREARESGLWLNGGWARTNRSGTHPFEPKRAFPFGPRTFGGGPLGGAECPSTTPAPRSLPLRISGISVIPCVARRRHRGRPRQTATGFRTASRRNQRPSAVVLAGPADSRGTADGQSPAQPTTRRGGAPSSNVRSRSRNCNRRRNPYNPVGGAATLGVWGRARAAVARRRDWSSQRLGRQAGWEHNRRGEGVQCAALTPRPKKRSDFASPRRHSP